MLVSASRTDADALESQLGAVGLRAKKNPPLNIVGQHAFLHFAYTPPEMFYDVQVDLMLAECELQNVALERSVDRTVPGMETPIKVVSCEDLMLFKLMSGRMIDLADIAMLLRENRPELNIDHLSKWVTQLGATSEFRTAWADAIVDEPCPV